MKDLNPREIAILVPLVVLMLVLGVAPNRFLEVSEQSTRSILELVDTKIAEMPTDSATDLTAVGTADVVHAN